MNVFKKLHAAFINNKFVKSYSRFITDPKHQKALNLTLLVIIAAAIPLTVFISQQQNDLRQRAEGFPTTPPLPQSPYACTYSESSFQNTLGDTTMPAGTPFIYSMKFQVNSTSDQIIHYNGLYDNGVRLNIPAQCKVLQNNLNGTNSIYDCSWNLKAEGAPSTHTLMFYLRDYKNSGEKTLCTPDKGQGVKQTTYTVSSLGNPKAFTPPSNWTGPAVTYTLSSQNPVAGKPFNIGISNKHNDKGIQYIALVVDGVAYWAAYGGGGDDTYWTVTLPAGQHTVRLAGNCDYSRLDPTEKKGPYCNSDVAKFYNTARITVLPNQ